MGLSFPGQDYIQSLTDEATSPSSEAQSPLGCDFDQALRQDLK